MQRFSRWYNILGRSARPLGLRYPRTPSPPVAHGLRVTPIQLDHCLLQGRRAYTVLMGEGGMSQEPFLPKDPPKSTGKTPKQCPGCGAAFQHEEASAPGYLPPSVLATRAAMTAEKEEGGAESSHREDIKRYEAQVEQLPEELREQFSPTPSTPKSTDTPTPSSSPARLICTRCHSLIHHNSLPQNASSVAPASLKSLAILGKRRNAVVVVVADLPSFPASLPENLTSVLGSTNPVVLVLTKKDVLPKGASEQRLRRYIWEVVRAREGAGEMPPVASVHLVSARKNQGVRELAADLRRLRGPQDHVYLTGRLNVGKSELVNALLRISVGGMAHKVTASWIPGTTAGHLSVPIWRFGRTLASPKTDEPVNASSRGPTNYRGQPGLFDTPGLANPRVTDLLSGQELRALTPHNQLKPLTYHLKPGNSLLLGAMARLDHVEGDHTILVTIFSGLLPHITTQTKADDLLARHAQGERTILSLGPQTSGSARIPLPPLVMVEEFEAKGKIPKMGTMDISWPGLGWVMLTGSFDPVRLRAWAVQGYGTGSGMMRRSPLMPYEYTGRVERFVQAGRKMRP